MQLLVSVRSVEEALLAAVGGADFVDLKEPSAGALGGLPIETIGAIVAALRERGMAMPISATVGDLAMDDVPAILLRVATVGACGVDYVKVGITREPGAAALLEALAASAHAVVPVFIADQGMDQALIDQACHLRFPAVMADTADKRSGSLFDAVPMHTLRGLVTQVQRAGKMAGLAGALRLHHIPALEELAPDFAGFRTAVCGADRTGMLDPARLLALATSLRMGRTPLRQAPPARQPHATQD